MFAITTFGIGKPVTARSILPDWDLVEGESFKVDQWQPGMVLAEDGMSLRESTESEAAAELKTALVTQIDDTVAAIYNRFTRFESEYTLREAQAQAYKDAGYTGTVPEQVAAFATPAGMDAAAATDLILSQAANLRGALSLLGAKRMRKYEVINSADAAAAQAVADEIIAEVTAIGGFAIVKLAIIFNQDKLSGKLTKFFTGCYAYHTAWVDEEHGLMYDMHLLRRRREWPHYSEGKFLMFDFPMVTQGYLERQLTTDENTYGMKDYMLFSLRGLFHLFGKSTPNANGEICSEMINRDIWACGGATPWPVGDAPPSPCDFHNWLRDKI